MCISIPVQRMTGPCRPELQYGVLGLTGDAFSAQAANTRLVKHGTWSSSSNPQGRLSFSKGYLVYLLNPKEYIVSLWVAVYSHVHSTSLELDKMSGCHSWCRDGPIHQERRLRVICIGAGASGLLFAYKLQRSFSNYSLNVYEKNSALSGTWFENRCK